MSNRIKYPRTPHLPWSPGATSDDRILKDTGQFKGKQVVVTEKMDGENCTIGQNYSHARSVDSGPHPSRTWVRGLQSQLGHELPDGWRLCGENLYAKHTLGYDQLPSYFLCFSIWDNRNVCLSWAETVEYCKMLGVHTVPVLYKGPWDEDKIISIFEKYSSPYGGEAEGYVVRNAAEFPYSAFSKNIGKYVRKAFKEQLEENVGESGHWMQQEVKPNKIIRQG